MTIKDRRARHKKATRDSILAAALQIAKDEGWGAVTIRRVADVIDYSAPIIYEYFASKDALLEELQDHGFALLTEALLKVQAEDVDPKEKLLRFGDAYIVFAYESPELYHQIMHGWNRAADSLETTLQRATAVAGIVHECLTAWEIEAKIVDLDQEAVADIAWALLHGLVSVEMMGRFRGGEDRVRQLARQTLNDLLTSWAQK